MGPVVVSLATGVIVLLGGMVVNGCRISKLLSTSNGAAGTGGNGGSILVVPSLVRDSAIAGTSAMRETNLAVSNGGTWHATTDDPWIHVSPASGGSRATVRMSLDPKDLPPGLHQGAVTVQEPETDGARATVAVSFLIQQPILKVSPGAFDFRAQTSSSVFRDTIYITNEGTGPLVWTATTEKHSAWFRFESDTAGTAPGFIALRASNEGLSYFGTFKETIILESPGAKNSPKRIEVTLRRKRGDGDVSLP